VRKTLAKKLRTSNGAVYVYSDGQRKALRELLEIAKPIAVDPSRAL